MLRSSGKQRSGSGIDAEMALTASSSSTRGEKDKGAKGKRRGTSSLIVIIGIAILFVVISVFLVSSGSHTTDQSLQQQQQQLGLHLSQKTGTSAALSHRKLPEIQSWTNRYGVMHAVQTRYMQLQGNLTHLGMARLELLETITLPSIQQQTNHEFLWVIWTDPDLDPTLKQPFLKVLDDAVQTMANQNNKKDLYIVVLAQNGMVTMPFPTSDKKLASIPLVYESHPSLLKAFNDASKHGQVNKMVAVTRLDADDALATDYIERVQKSASESFPKHTEARESRKKDEDKKKIFWQAHCIQEAYEWKHENALQQKQDTTAKDNAANAGALSYRPESFCLTPGLTITHAITKDKDDVPKLKFKHNQLNKLIPECNFDTEKKSKKVILDPCLTVFPNEDKLALRARSLTSASMRNVKANDEDLEFAKEQSNLWLDVTNKFGIIRDDVIRMRDAIEKDKYNILKEALMGQCTKGHSCMDRAKRTIEELMGAAATS